MQDFLTNYATKSIQTLWHPLTCKLTPVIKITGTENKIILLGDKLDAEEHCQDNISLNKGDHKTWQVN